MKRKNSELIKTLAMVLECTANKINKKIESLPNTAIEMTQELIAKNIEGIEDER